MRTATTEYLKSIIADNVPVNSKFMSDTLYVEDYVSVRHIVLQTLGELPQTIEIEIRTPALPSPPLVPVEARRALDAFVLKPSDLA